MNSRERVFAMINHTEPDRVPTGEWGIDHDHVSKILGHHTYWRNRKDTTIALWEGRRDEVVESLKSDYAELIDKLDYDVLTVERVPPKGHKTSDPPRKTGDGIWEDKKGRIYRYAPSNDSIMCMTQSEGKDEVTEEDVKNSYIKDIDPTTFELIDFISEKYGKEKILLSRDIDIYGCLMSPFGGGMTHHLIMSLESPDEIKKMYAPSLDKNIKLIAELKKHGVDIAMQGHDFCMNTGCFINPEIMRDVYFPFMKAVNDEIYKAGMIPFFHCCGNTWQILDDFVKAGYKGYQSIQKSAGMDTRRFKDEYGDKITMWTGVQCETLIEGTKEELQTEVRDYLKICMPGGGFIFGSTNSVQYGANTDNYLRAMEIVRNEGVYR